MEDLQRSKRLPDRTVFGLRLGHHYSRSKKDKWIGRMGRRKCQTASSTPQQRNPRGCWPMTRMTSRWLLKLVWHWKKPAHAVPCIEKKRAGKPQAIEAIEEQADSEKTGACGTVKRQHMDHIVEKRRCGEFSLWLGTQASFYWRSYENTWSQSRSG